MALRIGGEVLSACLLRILYNALIIVTGAANKLVGSAWENVWKEMDQKTPRVKLCSNTKLARKGGAAFIQS